MKGSLGPPPRTALLYSSTSLPLLPFASSFFFLHLLSSFHPDPILSFFFTSPSFRLSFPFLLSTFLYVFPHYVFSHFVFSHSFSVLLFFPRFFFLLPLTFPPSIAYLASLLPHFFVLIIPLPIPSLYVSSPPLLLNSPPILSSLPSFPSPPSPLVCSRPLPDYSISKGRSRT